MTIEEMLTAKEGENFEFKTAENRFSYTELQKYASAISNEGGGKIVFGITDKRPRKVVGSKAFDQPERTRKGLIDSLRINVDFEVFNDGAEKRVLVFIIPARPIGLPVQVDGVAWWRDGDSLVPMPEAVRQKIYEESGRDFSAEICKGAVWTDLDPNAIETFRRVWMENRECNPRAIAPRLRGVEQERRNHVCGVDSVRNARGAGRISCERGDDF